MCCDIALWCLLDLSYCNNSDLSVFSVPEFKCLDKKEILKIADVLQEVSLYEC